MAQWSIEKMPQWKHLLKKTAGDIKNVYQTSRGWVHKWPWGEEVIVGIGGLQALGAEPTVGKLEFTAASIANVAAQTVTLLVKFNEPVLVNTSVAGVPTVVILNGTANVTLTYNVAASNAATGVVAFKNAAVNGAAYGVGNVFTANSTGTRANWGSILDTANNSVNAANGFTGLSTTIKVA